MNNVVPTKEEVDSMYDSRRDMDMLGFEVDEYVPYMSYGKIRSMAKEEATDYGWDWKVWDNGTRTNG